MADNSNDFDSLQIFLEDENGQERGFEVVGTFSIQQEYMALYPLDENESGEVMLVRFEQGPDDSIKFKDIMEQEEYDRAVEAFEELFNQTEEEADGEDV